MVQLWVNLPKKDKSAKPAYQGILSADIPQVDLKDGAGKLRVIAGEYNGNKGPAHTFTPINLWDIRLNANHQVIFKVPVGHNTAVFVLSGEVVLNDGEIISNGDLAVLEREGETFSLKATQDAKILFLGGEPINEPVVGYGPFVMNSMSEIHQAFNDFRKMGQLS
jgi:redox-sensitive bicupin YhaK (pirin superfamily)